MKGAKDRSQMNKFSRYMKIQIGDNFYVYTKFELDGIDGKEN